MYDNYEQDKFVKLMKWAVEYPEIWDEICESNHDISAKRCYEIIENLENNSLHILIPILIFKNKHTDVLNATINQFAMDCILKVWEQEGRYALCQLFKTTLQEWEKIIKLRRTVEMKDGMME